MGECDFTELNNVSNIGELHKLLRNGFPINGRNLFEETPLILAVRTDKDVSLIKEFINSGADVNAHDCWGITPLYAAVTKREKNMRLVKLLLESGGEIKGGGKCVNDRALERTFMRNRRCAKLLIKYKFLRNYMFLKYPIRHKNSGNTRNLHLEYKDVVDLNIKPACYDTLGKFLDKCASDVDHMQDVILHNDETLLDFVSGKMNLESLDAGVSKQIFYQIIEELSSHHYRAYNSMIASRIGREYLLSNIEEQLFKRNSEVPANLHVNKIIPNCDLLHVIAKYLSDEDLLNFAMALILD